MLDRINGQSSSIQDIGLLQTSQTEQSERVKGAKAGKTSSVDNAQSFDKASISDEALSAWAQEKEMLKFSRLAQRQNADVDYDKVNRIKNLLDNGRINDYLNTVDTNSLVESLLSSPAAASFR